MSFQFRICPRCDAVFWRNGQKLCATCHAKNMKAWRKKKAAEDLALRTQLVRLQRRLERLSAR